MSNNIYVEKILEKFYIFKDQNKYKYLSKI